MGNGPERAQSTLLRAPVRPGPDEGLAPRLREVRRAIALRRQVHADEDATALLGEIDRTIGTLTALRGELLVRQRDSGAWRGAGDPSFEAWRGRTSRVGARAASAQVRQADTTARMPLVGDAVRDGDVTVEHLEVLSRVVSAAPAPVQKGLTAPSTQAELVAVARRVDATTFARTTARLAARLDQTAHERGHQRQRAARYLHLVDAPDGTRVSGLIDRMAGHRLRLALEAVTPRPAQDDERTAEQRRADALDTLAEKVLALPQTMTGAAVRPHVSFHLDARTWAAVREAQRARADDASTRDERPAVRLRDVEPVTLDDGTPVPLSEVGRALCDCELTRVVLDADGAPLDLGRTQRTYTGAQRRAVVARDRGCGWPSCHAEARWGEVHHVRWWDRDGGGTSVENGVLLCSFHHHEVHRRDLTLERAPGSDGVASVSYVVRGRGGVQVAPVVRGAVGAPTRGTGPPGGAGPPGGDVASGRGGAPGGGDASTAEHGRVSDPPLSVVGATVAAWRS